MKKIEFRNATREELEVRMQGQVYNPDTKQFGINLLIFKDARVDANILDETVGNSNWDRDYFEVCGQTYCKVTIRMEDGTTAYKCDVGTPSNLEAVKGTSSDAFKRACFSWGIARFLYSCPSIVVYDDVCNIKEKDGKKITYDKFSVAFLDIADSPIGKKIVGLVIVNENMNNKIAFTYGTGKDKEKVLKALVAEKGQSWEKVSKWLDGKGLKSANDMPDNEYQDCLRRLLV